MSSPPPAPSLDPRIAPPSWREEARIQWRLAGPLIAAQTALMFMGLVDTAVVGRFDEVELGGVAVGTAISFLLLSPAMGIVFALDPLISQSLGRGRPDWTWRWFRTGALVSVAVSVPLAVAGWGATYALPWLDMDPALIEATRRYLLWRLPAAPAFTLVLCCKSLLQAHGKTLPLITSALVANVLNWGIDWLAVFGDGALERVGLPGIGLPALGGAGAALATGATSMFMAAWLLRSIWPYRRIRPPTAHAALQPFPADPARRVLALGVPIGMQFTTEVSAFAFAGILAGKLGPVIAGAHSIAMQLASFTFMVGVAFSSAAAVRVGHAVGRGEPVRTPGAVATVMALMGMGTSALIFANAPELLAALFTPDNPESLRVAVPLIRIAAAFQLFDGVQVVMAGALRGAGDVQVPFLANVAAHWGVGIPTAIILAFPMGMGAPGLWYGLTASLVTVSTLLAWRFFGAVSRGAVVHVA